MKLLLCTLNARYTHFSLALRYLRAALSDSGHEVILREYLINQNLHQIVLDLAMQQPDVLLCSVYIWNSRQFAALLPDVRSLLPGLRIIVGGPEVAWQPQDWLHKVPQTDLVVSGPGESAMAALEAAGWDCLCWPDKVLPAPALDFRALVQPYAAADFADFVTRYVYYESSRGCPFSCSYCLSSNEAHRLQLKDSATVCSELDELLRHQPRLIKFVDRTFNADAVRSRQIWSHLIAKHGSGATRFHFEIHPALLEAEDFALLAAIPSGLFQFEIGVQTIHERSRKEIRRTGNWVREQEAIRSLVALKTIHIHVDLIAGLPGEGIADIAESFNALCSLSADHVQFGFLKVLPGTLMAARKEQYGLVHQLEAPYEILRTATLSEKDLSFLKQIDELLDSVGNSHHWDALINAAAARIGSHFEAYKNLLEYCIGQGFDIRTRNREKLGPLLAGWLQLIPD